MGFTLPARITPAAVRSYRTFSPLPFSQDNSRKSGGIFSVTLSVKFALSEPPRPLAGMLPYGDRTFLPINQLMLAIRAITRPTDPLFSVALFLKRFVTVTVKSESIVVVSVQCWKTLMSVSVTGVRARQNKRKSSYRGRG